MKKKRLKPYLIAVFAALTIMSASMAASVTSFTDVTKNHWAYTAINWGATSGIINGYEDGSYKPSQFVTESEFLKMLVSTFDASQKPESGDKWYSGYYTYAKQKNWDLMSNNKPSAKTAVINRQKVAELVSSAQGLNYKGDQAIQYLLGSELSNGKTNNTIDGYEGADSLTRAEAIQFLMNLKNKGMTELKDQPTEKSDPALLPPLPVSTQNNTKLSELSKKDIPVNSENPFGGRFVEFMEQDKQSEEATKEFISSIVLTDSKISFKIPKYPSGYTVYLTINGGAMQKVEIGKSVSLDVSGVSGLQLSALVDAIPKQTVTIQIPSGKYFWGAKHEK